MASSSRSRPVRPEIACPLCDFTADHEYIIHMHFDAIHDHPEPPPEPKQRPKQRQEQRQEQPRQILISSISEESDAYDPFKYQVPNNNSQEIVGHPVYRNIRAEDLPSAPAVAPRPTAAAPAPHLPSAPTRAPPAPPTRPAAPTEVEYVTCGWNGCGEPVSLLQLDEHVSMHEEILEAADDEDEPYVDEEALYRDRSVGQHEAKGEALMEAADEKKRNTTKKEGPSDRLRKKMGQKERREEREALMQAEEDMMHFEEDDDLVKVQKVQASDDGRQSDEGESTSNEYEIISKQDLEEDEVEANTRGEEEKKKKKKREKSSGQKKGSEHRKEKSDSKHRHRHHHHHHHHSSRKPEEANSHNTGKKLQKQFYGGYSLGGLRFYPKKEPVNDSSSTLKPKFKKSELGPYANESRMPEWLKDALSAGGKEVITRYIGADGLTHAKKSYANETSGLIPVIRNLIFLDPNVSKAYLCHPSVKHVFKEHSAASGFCGYRNIQMLASYCQKNLVSGCERLFGERIPTIIQIQKWIENAWDMGINAHARAETGGILYTRKYIGSSEVEAMFTSFGTSTIPRQFSEPDQQESALRHAWTYFSSGHKEEEEQEKVVITQKPPIYFQHHGHSMTIVGVERYNDGSLCFICFDPMFSPSSAIRTLVGQNRLRPGVSYGKLLKAFRRGSGYLKRYTVFEMVELASSESDTSLYD